MNPHPIPAALQFPLPASHDSPAAPLSLSTLCRGIEGREEEQRSDKEQMRNTNKHMNN